MSTLYRTVYSEAYRVFDDDVNQLLQDGWSLHGPAYIYNGTRCQVLVRRVERETVPLQTVKKFVAAEPLKAGDLVTVKNSGAQPYVPPYQPQCKCPCHTMPGIMHFTECCQPDPIKTEEESIGNQVRLAAEENELVELKSVPPPKKPSLGEKLVEAIKKKKSSEEVLGKAWKPHLVQKVMDLRNAQVNDLRFGPYCVTLPLKFRDYMEEDYMEDRHFELVPVRERLFRIDGIKYLTFADVVSPVLGAIECSQLSPNSK